MSKPFFSVIIPTYNRKKLLALALESVWAQCHTDYEIIVVDDGSDDGTWGYLESLGDKITALQQVNAGPGAARNFGADHAVGDYLMFLDSDDLWFVWTLETFFIVLKKHDYPAVVCGRLLPFKDGGEVKHIEPSTLDISYYEQYGIAAAHGHYAGAGMIAVSRRVFQDANGFTTEIRNSEDHDLMLKLTTVPGFVTIRSPYTLARRLDCEGLTLNLDDSYGGLLYLINAERRGAYPGGSTLAGRRRYIITQHARACAVSLLRGGELRKATSIYIKTCLWHIMLGRWRFLFGFPAKLIIGRIRSK